MEEYWKDLDTQLENMFPDATTDDYIICPQITLIDSREYPYQLIIEMKPQTGDPNRQYSIMIPLPIDKEMFLGKNVKIPDIAKNAINSITSVWIPLFKKVHALDADWNTVRHPVSGDTSKSPHTYTMNMKVTCIGNVKERTFTISTAFTQDGYELGLITGNKAAAPTKKDNADELWADVTGYLDQTIAMSSNYSDLENRINVLLMSHPAGASI